MKRLGRLIWLIITIILVMVVIAFSASNKTLVTLYLWPFENALTAPVWLVIISSFIIGGVLSLIILWAQWLAIRTKLWRLQKKFNNAQTQVKQQKYSTDEAHKGVTEIVADSSNYTSSRSGNNVIARASDQHSHEPQHEPQTEVSSADQSSERSKAS